MYADRKHTHIYIYIYKCRELRQAGQSRSIPRQPQSVGAQHLSVANMNIMSGMWKPAACTHICMLGCLSSEIVRQHPVQSKCDTHTHTRPIWANKVMLYTLTSMKKFPTALPLSLKNNCGICNRCLDPILGVVTYCIYLVFVRNFKKIVLQLIYF